MYSFKIRSAVSVAVLVLGATLTFPFSAMAAQCTANPPRISDFSSEGSLPPPPTVDQALDQVYSLAWTLDNRDINNFDNVFTTDAVYEACTGGGIQIVATQNLAALKDYFKTQPFAYLIESSSHTSHFITNPIVRTAKKEGEIRVLASMLVTIQRPDREGPDLDYTASLVISLRPDNGALKLFDVRMLTATPQVVLRAR